LVDYHEIDSLAWQAEHDTLNLFDGIPSDIATTAANITSTLQRAETSAPRVAPQRETQISDTVELDAILADEAKYCIAEFTIGDARL